MEIPHELRHFIDNSLATDYQAQSFTIAYISFQERPSALFFEMYETAFSHCADTSYANYESVMRAIEEHIDNSQFLYLRLIVKLGF